MRRLIVNADDCGISDTVNKSIAELLEMGRVSSVSVLANGASLNGALDLYERFGSEVSFGVHLNLTEGSPLTESQVLLDVGFCREVEGRVVFNGKPGHQ